MIGDNAIEYEYTPSEFDVDITWEDVLDKLDDEYAKGTCKIVYHLPEVPPSFVCHSKYKPGSLRKAAEEVYKEVSTEEMHVYVSVAGGASTFERHCDDKDVLLVGGLGKVSYWFDDDKEITLNPGDSLFIEAGTYHRPEVHGPRATLSFTLGQ